MTDQFRAGWGKTKISVRSSDCVLDIGSGAYPNPRANFLADMHVSENRHRNGNEVAVDARPFVQADVSKLPFADHAIDYVIVSHLAEHVADPDALCRELSRASRRGYIETPSPLGDRLLDEEYHLWRVGNRQGVLHFVEKGNRSALVVKAADFFYYLYNAGEDRSKTTLSLPTGPVGKVIRLGLKIVRGVLNRTGIMVTRIEFGPDSPLRWEVERLPANSRNGSEVASAL